MLSVTENFKTGKLALRELPSPICRPGSVLVANRASLLSAGTERAAISLARKTLVGKALERPDLVRQVVNKLRRDGLAATVSAVRARLDAPIQLGYSCAGVALEVAKGAEGFRPGDRVACAGANYATHSEVVCVPKNLCARIPEGVSFEDACYLTPGAIAMHGVRRAGLGFGETALVIGCGLLGLLTVQILAGAGVKVFAVDIDESKLELAGRLAADAACRPGSRDLAGLARDFTGGNGFDAVLVTAATSSSDPLRLAALLARDRARVVVVGDVGMNVRRRPFYEKELTLVMSRSYGPGRYDANYEERGIEYPLSYVRWGERRNLEEFLRMVAAGKVDVSALTTHTFDITDAPAAYEVVLGRAKEPYVGIVLSYRKEPSLARKVDLARAGEPAGAEKIGVGFVGAGAFARSVLLGALSKCERAEGIVICSAGGLSAEHAGRRFGFRHAATDFQEVLDDERVNAVVIATPHNLHASQAAAALAAGKHVFVEKPLALATGELAEVRSAHDGAKGILMVGFNRRFSPHALAAKELFAGRKRPLTINYRVNAGTVPPDSWVRDPAVGGGRVLGEVCHFIDLATFLAGSPPRWVFAAGAGGSGAVGEDADTIALTLTFSDGTLAVITYVSAGEESLPKERVEIDGGGATALIEDFRVSWLYRGGKRRRLKTARDKGHKAEMEAFFGAVASGRAPVSFDELCMVTLATFAVVESLAKGEPVALEELA